MKNSQQLYKEVARLAAEAQRQAEVLLERKQYRLDVLQSVGWLAYLFHGGRNKSLDLVHEIELLKTVIRECREARATADLGLPTKSAKFVSDLIGVKLYRGLVLAKPADLEILWSRLMALA